MKGGDQHQHQHQHQQVIEDSKNPNHHHNNMFPNLHHHYQQQQQQHPYHHHHHQHQNQQQPFHHQHQQLQLTRGGAGDCQTSSEDNETRSSGARPKKVKKDIEEPTYSSGGGAAGGGGGERGIVVSDRDRDRDGATIEVVRRPRGRPPGSKNKPKPPIIITRDIGTECAMRPHVLEITSGHDIIDSISRFSRKRNLGLCILTASGSVTNVSLRQPTSTPGHSTVTFHGRFDILSISATFLPPTTTPPTTSATSHQSSPSVVISSSSPTNSFNDGFTISLAGPQGQIFGGSVIGSLMAASTVFIVASSFTNPSYHRLPMVEDGVSGGGGNQTQQQPQPLSMSAAPTGSEEESNPESCSMAMNYSCHLPSDVIWAPTPRQPPPPPPF